jgi:hypothetical protein
MKTAVNMRSGSMKMLSDARIKKFRDKFYWKNVPGLFQKGGKGLNPLERYKKDEQGLIIVSVEEISRFFFREIEREEFLHPDYYFDGLLNLFVLLAKGSESFSFDRGIIVSEEDIQRADNETAIRYLTTNLIITYCNNLKISSVKVDTRLLSDGLGTIIQKSSAGRDYRTLAGYTLNNLVSTLAEDKPWQEYLQDINEADLICQLVGAKLPKLDKKVLTGMILKSRNEIQDYILVFRKILDFRQQLASQEKNSKKFLKAMVRIDDSIHTVLEKIDLYLMAAQRLMKIIGVSWEILLGPIDQDLKANLAWFIWDFKPGVSTETSMGYASARYRVSLLFEFRQITFFCCTYKGDDTYNELSFDFFRVYFNELIQKMNRAASEPEGADTQEITQCFLETKRLIEKLSLEERDMIKEKQDVKDAYVALIKATPFEKLSAVMDLLGIVLLVTQDSSREIMTPIRKGLFENCFSALSRCADQPLANDTLQNEIKKLIHSYAVHYKPQRSFYQMFFTLYLGTENSSPSTHFLDLVKKNKAFVLALLVVFSDSKSMEVFLLQNQIIHAKMLLGKFKNMS